MDTKQFFSIVGKPPGPFSILHYKDYIAVIAGIAATIPVFIKIPIWIVKTSIWLNRKRSTKKKMEHTEKCLAGGEECNCAISMSEQANAGFARDDSTTATRLLDKNWSPMIVRKYQMEGWPMYVGLICDANLNDLDDVVYKIMDEAEDNGFINGTIQGTRNACGLLSDRIVQHYNNVKRGVTEGVIICWYVDKCFVSSAYGDFMTHEKCAMEFYQILNTLPHI
jgi:hypothetical protein